ncbi:MAG: hypothetical protein OEQ39_09085, partial [Gammaproteobacteria bacterium]|nr:hypothetical protein [Gammaproteobacteria bacterium]
PFWTHKLTEATDTTLRYEFEDVAFEDGAQVGLIDYRNHSVDVSVTHRLNVSTNLIGSIDYQRFESEDTTDSDSVGLLIGLERIFSPRFQAGLSLGAESTDIEFFVADGTRENRSDSMAIFTTNATWTLENGSFLIEGSRREEPSAQGSLSNLEQVQATWQQALTPVYELILGVGASQREFAPVGSQAAEDRKYYNAEARIVWRGRPRWQIDFAYQYRRQEFDDPQGGVTGDASNRADSSAVWLTAGYTWTRIGLFR